MITTSRDAEQKRQLLVTGYKHTLGDLRRAVALLNQDIATLGTKSRRNSPSKGVDTLQELSTSLDTEFELLAAVSLRNTNHGDMYTRR